MRERGRLIAVVSGLLVIVLVSVVFVTSRQRDGVSFVESAVRDGLAPLFLAVNRATKTVTGAWDSALAVRNAHAENERLRDEVTALRQQLAALEEARRENEALRSVLDLPSNTPREVVFGEVIARPLNNWWSGLTINKGRRDGITPQMGVVTSAGVVGHVRSVSHFTAEVVLLIDPRSAVGGIIQRTGEPVLVEGTGPPGTELRVRMLTAGTDIEPGDVIVTSGLSRLFSKGIPIGIVDDVEVGAFGLSVDATVQPFVDFSTLEFVTVVEHPAASLEAPDNTPDDAPAESEAER